jgi:hypothetical protein
MFVTEAVYQASIKNFLHVRKSNTNAKYIPREISHLSLSQFLTVQITLLSVALLTLCCVLLFTVLNRFKIIHFSTYIENSVKMFEM